MKDICKKYIEDPTISDMYGESKNQCLNCGNLKKTFDLIYRKDLKLIMYF